MSRKRDGPAIPGERRSKRLRGEAAPEFPFDALQPRRAKTPARNVPAVRPADPAGGIPAVRGSAGVEAADSVATDVAAVNTEAEGEADVAKYPGTEAGGEEEAAKDPGVESGGKIDAAKDPGAEAGGIAGTAAIVGGGTAVNPADGGAVPAEAAVDPGAGGSILDVAARDTTEGAASTQETIIYTVPALDSDIPVETIAYRDQDVRFRCVLKVQIGHDRPHCLLTYRLDAYITLPSNPAADPNGETPDDAEDIPAANERPPEEILPGETHAGFIVAYRINKRTLQAPNASNAWIPDILNANDPNDPIYLCLKSLFKADGQPYVLTKVSDTATAALRDKKLMDICMVQIVPALRGNGLFLIMWRRFLALLSVLPEWYSFEEGVMVLEPAPPEEGSFSDMTDLEIETVLIRNYQRVGFETWRNNVSVGPVSGGSSVTSMGLILPAE